MSELPTPPTGYQLPPMGWQPQQPPPPPKSRAGTILAVVVVIALIGTGVWYFFLRDKRVAGCTDETPALVASFMSPSAEIKGRLSDISKAASLNADGGTYYAAKLNTDDGAELVWFRTSAGTTYSVGKVTALYSIFPDSAQYTKVSVSSDGFDDVKTCVN